MTMTPEQKNDLANHISILYGGIMESTLEAATLPHDGYKALSGSAKTIYLLGSALRRTVAEGGEAGIGKEFDNPAKFTTGALIELIVGLALVPFGAGILTTAAVGVGVAYFVDILYEEHDGFRNYVDRDVNNQLGNALDYKDELVQSISKSINNAVEAVNDAYDLAGDNLLDFKQYFESGEMTDDIRNAILDGFNDFGETLFGDEWFDRKADFGDALSPLRDALQPVWDWLLLNLWNDPELEALEKSLNNESATPIIFDMDSDGIELTALDTSKTTFDMDNDGFAERTGWVKPDDALLAVDVNGNGKIDDQSELFGKDKTYADGYLKLKGLFNSNGDTVINASDTNFNKLRVWQDLNSNGISEAGELKTLAQAGITSISLADTFSTRTIAGHDVLKASTFVRHGQTREVLDMVFDNTLFLYKNSIDTLAGMGNVAA
jgi:hypothetical protein